VIVGGESGGHARPMHPDWARDLRDQCATAGVPFLFKQWGEWAPIIDRERDDSNEFADRGNVKWLNLAGGCGFHGERFHVMRRIGKKATGRLLDGVEHNGFPQVPA
jgi:protein gp37